LRQFWQPGQLVERQRLLRDLLDVFVFENENVHGSVYVWQNENENENDYDDGG
jgi:hypothetical protein